MKNEKLLQAIGKIDDELVYGAIEYKRAKKKNTWVKWAAMAACLCLVVAMVPAVLHTINPQNELKGLEISENFMYEGVEYYIIGDDDSPEHYGFPAEITGELAGKQNAYLFRDENNDLLVTDEKSDIIVFEYALAPCTAAKIIRYGDSWYSAVFVGVASSDTDTSKQLNLATLYQIYNVNSYEDIQSIRITPYESEGLDSFYTTEGRWIENFYLYTKDLISHSADEFNLLVYEDCETEEDREAVDSFFKSDFCKLNIETNSGLIMRLQLYPTTGWMRSINGHAYYMLTDDMLSWYNSHLE